MFQVSEHFETVNIEPSQRFVVIHDSDDFYIVVLAVEVTELSCNVETALDSSAVNQYPLKSRVFSLIADKESAVAETLVEVDQEAFAEDEQREQQKIDHVENAVLVHIRLGNVGVDTKYTVADVPCNTCDPEQFYQTVVLDYSHSEPESTVDPGYAEHQHKRCDVRNRPEQIRAFSKETFANAAAYYECDYQKHHIQSRMHCADDKVALWSFESVCNAGQGIKKFYS